MIRKIELRQKEIQCNDMINMNSKKKKRKENEGKERKRNAMNIIEIKWDGLERNELKGTEVKWKEVMKRNALTWNERNMK